MISLKKLQILCKQHETLLIFDEVISGFGIANGGAQSFFQVFPDITILGKSLASGMPVGAIGGRKEIMDSLAPKGPVYSAGTFSGNPMTVQCGIAALDLLGNRKMNRHAEELTLKLCTKLKNFIQKNNLPIVINQIGQIFSLFFTNLGSVTNEAEMRTSDFMIFSTFHKYLLHNGVYLSPPCTIFLS
jgi:glutamate-1-semialdehyde 2,1-aminomutase